MAVSANILVIDSDESVRAASRQALAQAGLRVRVAENGALGLRAVEEESFDVILLDLNVPGIGGIELLGKLKEQSPDSGVIVIAGLATIESAVEAMRTGAHDYLPKPFEQEALVAVVKRALERRRLALENSYIRLALKEKPAPNTIVGGSAGMVEVTRLIQKVAPTDATVLLLGETGVGKELVARALHSQSHRRDKPFVAVDCAALVPTLFESELFGHVRGAYTGAFETTVGKFELASGGTIFFDEIGSIGKELQAKLLRAIQEREIIKVGSTRRTKIDVRIVAATNNDLVKDIRNGEFREDLFFRLSVIPVRLPPLRERTEDVRLLAKHFLERFAVGRRRRVAGFSEDALKALEAYDWPGNVRELENAVERAVVMADGEVIKASDFHFYGPVRSAASEPRQPGGQLAVSERREIAAALDRFDWQMAKAAEYLGINRKTLRDKIRRYGMGAGDRGQGTGDRGQGTGDRGQGTGVRGQHRESEPRPGGSGTTGRAPRSNDLGRCTAGAPRVTRLTQRYDAGTV